MFSYTIYQGRKSLRSSTIRHLDKRYSAAEATLRSAYIEYRRSSQSRRGTDAAL